MIYAETRSSLKLVGLMLVATLLGGIILWAAQRAAPNALQGADKARIEATVRDYVLAHPEIIPEAMRLLQQRETGKSIAANRAQILEPFGDAWIGNPKGDVTLVEYFDYNCGYCRSSLPVIAELVRRDPNVRVVFKEFPILSEQSVTAARLSLAAAAQGKFKPFHDALYAAGPVSEQTMQQAAKTAGLDLAKAAAMTPKAEAEIAANRRVAQTLGLTGTPSWVIGTKVVSAALPLEELEKAVKEARAQS
ncbi:DsbA family protein [Sphingomonas hylomeconis]|uniref:DsbA family protein n=1 Tax=Sphingomonas hylomeconis TaxID=1395958 RepID=A0ABV7SYJ8_9SPHN|nr:DsbA family protein [Sphingomonas hylomeconis]